MGIDSLLTQSLDLRYATSSDTDDYGQPVIVESTEPVTGYLRRGTTGVNDAAYSESSELRAIVPATVDLDGLVGVSVDGVDYDLAGVPHKQWNPRRQAVEYVTFPVRRTVS